MTTEPADCSPSWLVMRIPISLNFEVCFVPEMGKRARRPREMLKQHFDQVFRFQYLNAWDQYLKALKKQGLDI